MQSINLNYQLSHYMPTIKQWHTQIILYMNIAEPEISDNELSRIAKFSR